LTERKAKTKATVGLAFVDSTLRTVGEGWGTFFGDWGEKIHRHDWPPGSVGVVTYLWRASL
jgi:hypothetical protein